MHNKRPPVPVIVLLLLVLLIAGYYGLRSLFNENNDGLQASGSIEATEISVSPELSGQVVEVFISEGDTVKKGDRLLLIEDELLTAQHQAVAASVRTAKSAAQTAEAAFTSAQTQYEIALTNALTEDNFKRIEDWVGEKQDPFDQPNWYFTREEEIQAAQSVFENAQKKLDEAQANLSRVVSDITNTDYFEAEKRLADARIDYLIMKDVYDRAKLSKYKVDPTTLEYPDIPRNFEGGYIGRIRIAKELSDDPNLVNAAQDAYDEAKSELQSAQIAYNDLLTTAAAIEVLNARAKVEIAVERVEAVRDYLISLQTGENSLVVDAARDAMNQSRASMEQANTVVLEAEAQLALLDVQINKLTVISPIDGTVLIRNVEPGELVQAGAIVFTLANLDDLTITVYVPEDRYGEISLSQHAEVKVDSFPNETFSAQVTNIADTAEYTPRNVQTVEGRSATVYAVKLIVEDPTGKLKPGMPADVSFNEE